MKTILLIIMLCLTAGCFALTGFAVSSVNATLDNTTTLTEDPTPTISESMLGSAYPNPFRTGIMANISVTIKAGETGRVTIYNLRGQTVKTFPLKAGEHTLSWDGKDSSSGIYFYKLITPSIQMTRKLVWFR